MASFFGVNTKLSLVQVWNQNPVAFLLVQVLCLPLDLICDAPPFLKGASTSTRMHRLLSVFCPEYLACTPNGIRSHSRSYL